MKHFKYIIPLTLIYICQLTSAQTPEQLRAWLPVVEGWTLSEETEVFNPDNLFDRINGAAPLYLENNFREMTSLEYKKGDDYITIQAYRHATPVDAFGMYASERSSDLEFLPVGGEAQSGDKNFYFFAGNMYVKMQGSSQGDIKSTLQQIGKELAVKIDPQADYPSILKLFPEKGKIPYSESYITSSYIGHDFLSSVYTVKYDNNGQEFQLFVIDGTSKDGSKAILDNYFAFTGQNEAFNEGALLIKDKYNGEIPVIWKGRYIVGVFSEKGERLEDSTTWINDLSQKL